MASQTDLVASVRELRAEEVAEVYIVHFKKAMVPAVEKIRRKVLTWVEENLVLPMAPLAINSFGLPFKNLLLSQMRSLYIFAFREGSDEVAPAPIEVLRAKADLAVDNLVKRIERDLKNNWNHIGTNLDSLVNLTNEVFDSVVS